MDTNIGKQAGDKTGASKQGNPAVSPDKRRAHQAHDDKNVDKPFSHHIIPGHNIGDGHTHH